MFRKLVQMAAALAVVTGSGNGLAADKKDERYSPQIAEFVKNFTPGGALPDGSATPTPQESIALFAVADGIKVDAPLHEPEVAQSLNMSFDERGRLWVVQYLQYPYPAGLKVVKYDKYLRAVFDKVPPPPPHHTRGKDKVTIHEDTDGDGEFDQHKTFVDGLNMARSVITGRGGAWVLMPPYLLFYPDRNRDDVPDGDPVVHLEGFGLEDTHSGANSLRWGPDGWIYGAHGSTCTADIKGVKFLGQAIWRYHPETQRFEVFAEGGGNTYSLDFDKNGRVFSGSNYGKTRGLHYPQGGAFIKGWGKHGPLMNPYSFGWFEHMKHQGYSPRFAQTMIVYEGGEIPQLEGQIVAGMALTSRVQASKLSRDTSSFQTKDTDVLINSTNRWFRPVDTKAGPDGAIYIADWCDSRLSHLDPRDTWSKTTGRIYRLRDKNHKPQKRFDYGNASNGQLLKTLEHPNKWHRQTALRVLHDRRDRSLLPRLNRLVAKEKGQLALEAFWAVNACGGFTEKFATQCLSHENPMIRFWTTRLIGDDDAASDKLKNRVLALAKRERVDEVRVQIASTAKRLPAKNSLPIVRNLITAEKDADDIHIPLLVWWALENKAASHRSQIESMLEDSTLWETPIGSRFIISRLGQRYTAERSDDNLRTAAKLIGLAPSDQALDKLIEGMDKGLQGDPVKSVPKEMQQQIARLWKERKHDARLITVAARLKHGPALEKALVRVVNREGSSSEQSALIKLVADQRDKSTIPTFMSLLRQEKNSRRQIELIQALSRFYTTRIADLFIESLPNWSASTRVAAVNALASRLEWSQLLLDAVDLDHVRTEWISIGNLISIQEYGCDHCNGIISKHWGRLRQSSEEKQKEIARVKRLLAKGKGDVKKGEELFKMVCSTCHRLGKTGKHIGPNLTGYERDNLNFIIPAIVDPSLAIREEYTTFNLLTKDGQSLTGFLSRNDPRSITFMDLTGSKQVIARHNIANLAASQTSLMPEGLTTALTDEQLRDLLAFFITHPAKTL
ncbi:MAG: PVC-type heme-binding CxxCH protein [Limisphaerales bacterium]